jgi:hypothetical protein
VRFIQTYIVLPLLLIAVSATAKETVSPFNKRKIEIADSSSYTFFIGGHFHGASTNISGFPAATLLANLDKINSADASFMISLGDLFLSVKRDMKNYRWTFFDKLQMPIFNAVGNHDIEEVDYVGRFGRTYNSFQVGTEKYIILDTELDNGHITGKQLSFFKKQIKAAKTDGTKNVFVFAHRPIWSEENSKLEGVFKENTKGGTNFKSTILPLLKKLPSSLQTYWFGGSMGGRAPASFFYFKERKNLTYIATAIRNLPRDGILKVTVKQGKVSFLPISFTGRKVEALEKYGPSYWKKHDKEEAFNPKLIPLYIWQMISHRYFWYGLFYAVFGFFCLVLTLRIVDRIRKKKRG